MITGLANPSHKAFYRFLAAWQKAGERKASAGMGDVLRDMPHPRLKSGAMASPSRLCAIGGAIVASVHIGVTRQAIIAFEQGRYSPFLEMVLKLTRVLNISQGEVFQHINEGTK